MMGGYAGGAFQEILDARRHNRMTWIDQQPKAIRELVHEYGLNIVKAFMDCGMKQPKHIRHCVERVLDEFSPTRGTYSSQGIRTPHIGARSNGKTEAV